MLQKKSGNYIQFIILQNLKFKKNFLLVYSVSQLDCESNHQGYTRPAHILISL